jgi:SPP1 gp7 family putative phage head morphogenesis protein
MSIWGEGEALCYIKTRFEPEEDLNEKAKRYTTLITAGARIGEDHFYETFDIPKPKDGEATIIPASADPLAAALGGAMGGRMANSRIQNNRTKKARTQRYTQAADQTETLLNRALREIPSVYETLVEDLPADETAVDLLFQRKDEFKAKFSDAIGKVLREAMDISSKALGEGDVFEGLRPNKIDPFKVRNLSALDWLNFHTFSLTQIEGEVVTVALMKRLKDELINFVDSGISPKEFYQRVLDAEGVGPIGRGHLQTVLRTNVATARSAGTELAIDRNPGKFPAWEFSAVGDGRTRADHKALDGKVFDIRDRRFWPPLDYNCRCEAMPVHYMEMDDEQYEIASSAEQSVEVSRGFGSDARTNYSRWVDSERRKNPELNTILSSILGDIQ